MASAAAAQPKASPVSWIPKTDAEETAVRRQLDRILESPLFSQSHRYPNLLRYIVEETLAGRGDQLKERTVGIEVFGRAICYNTDEDSIVRTSAAQVRRKLNQYYQQFGHESEIRIDLLPGSYVPQLHPIDLLSEPVVRAPRRRRRLVLYACSLICIAAAGSGVWFRTLSNPVADFWGPIWDESNRLTICVPGKFPAIETTIDAPQAGQTALSVEEAQRLNSISWEDASALYQLTAFLRQHGQAYKVRREGDVVLADLRAGPAVLIGGLTNSWFMRLNSQNRFSYHSDPQGNAWIEDAQNPSQRIWKVDGKSPFANFHEDYGIISRIVDSTTRKFVVAISGLSAYAPIAGARLLTNPDGLAFIERAAPKGWQRKNLQVVFSATVFDGFAGPPKVLLVHVW